MGTIPTHDCGETNGAKIEAVVVVNRDDDCLEKNVSDDQGVKKDIPAVEKIISFRHQTSRQQERGNDTAKDNPFPSQNHPQV